jgi:PAS domain S-box-containing protein
MVPSDIAERIVRNAPDAIVYCDREGTVRFWNDACVRIFGHTSEEATGQTLDIIIPENLRERHWRGFAETMRTGQTRYGAGDLLSVPALRKDGARISVEFSIIPFKDADGTITGMAAIMRDVTARFEEMKALRKASQTHR